MSDGTLTTNSKRRDVRRGAYDSNGTIIKSNVIPTSEGVVIVADGFSTFNGRPMPALNSKIGLVPGRYDLAFAITGTSTWLPPPLPSDIDSIKLASSNSPLFTGQQIVLDSLKETAFQILSKEIVEATARHLGTKISEFFNSYPALQLAFRGQNLCRLLVVQFTSQDRVTRIGTTILMLDDLGNFTVAEAEFENIGQSDARFIGQYGETEYVDQHVLAGYGQRFLRPDFGTLWNTPILVNDMSHASAAAISVSLIEATEKTAALIPITTWVGGAPSIVLLDGRKLPRLLKFEDFRFHPDK